MLIPDNMTVHLYCGVTDMRKSINTLTVMVQDVLKMEPTNGHLFLFRSRGGDKLKALHYEEHCFTLWYRRLDKGKFIFPRNIQGHLELTREHFNWLLASNKFVNYQGVYCFDSSAQITGVLTLNGAKCSSYTFQIGSTLTAAASSKVVLTGGVKDVNWAIGSSATLGANSTIQGILDAVASITATTSASISGRACAQNGAVTLDDNAINLCH